MRGDPHRDRATMKTPVVLVTAALTAAILLAATLLIATGSRGEEAALHTDAPALTNPAAK
jgi:aldose sugar dehydrogenase